MKVLLVAIHPYPSPQAVPLANAFLKSSLVTDEELAGMVTVELRDFLTGEDPAACVAALLAENPDAVGFSCYLWNRQNCREIAAELRRQLPELILFAGGPDPTADPAGMLR